MKKKKNKQPIQYGRAFKTYHLEITILFYILKREQDENGKTNFIISQSHNSCI